MTAESLGQRRTDVGRPSWSVMDVSVRRMIPQPAEFVRDENATPSCSIINFIFHLSQ